jgi:hypothetical protein
LDKGDSVEFVFCSGLIPICEINRDKDITTCLYCISRRNQGVKLLSKKIKKYSLSFFTKTNDRNIISNLRFVFKNREDLQNYKLANFCIGSAVYSSIADLEREYLPDLENYQKEVKDFMVTSAHIYLSFKNYLSKRKSDIVYLYNGRHALEKPVIASCKELGVKFYTHECAYNGGYELFENTQPQDYNYRYNSIDKVWRNSTTPEREKLNIGRFFYEKNVGRQQGNINFSIKNNKPSIIHNKYLALDKIKTEKVLPSNWEKDKENIVWFPSSEFEDQTAPEYCDDKIIYSSQIESINRIIEDTNKNSNRHCFYIRLHPTYSLFHTKVQEQNQYESLKNKFKNVTLIYPDSKFCSYHLMDHADKVMAFRSTAGAESAYRMKPTIMLNKHILYQLKSFYSPKSHADVMNFVTDENIKPLDNYDSIKFGFFNLMSGRQSKYYVRDITKSYEEGWGLFKGKEVIPSKFITTNIIPFLNKRKIEKIKDSLNRIHYYLINKYLGV